jgi:hypothetical protein
VLRQALSRPKRTARKLPTTAANSASGNVAACSFTPLNQAGSSFLKSSTFPMISRTARTDASFALCVFT